MDLVSKKKLSDTITCDQHLSICLSYQMLHELNRNKRMTVEQYSFIDRIINDIDLDFSGDAMDEYCKGSASERLDDCKGYTGAYVVHDVLIESKSHDLSIVEIIQHLKYRLAGFAIVSGKVTELRQHFAVPAH